eukprot:maker-scaffold_48-snap-gene-0.33-mRNA-1 protein AED:0.00 eAED:0.00 QI:90/1/1/1/1/1/2/253/337
MALGLTIVSWESMGLLGQNLTEEYPHPFFIAWFVRSCYILSAIPLILMQKRVNYDIKKIFFIPLVHFISFLGGLLSVLASAFWYYSLPLTILSANNAIYQAVPLWVFIFSVIFLKKEPTKKKILGLSVCFFGVLLVSIYTKSETNPDGSVQSSTLVGYILVLLSALLLSCFEVMFEFLSNYFLKNFFDGSEFQPLSKDSEDNRKVEIGEKGESLKGVLTLVVFTLAGVYNILFFWVGIYIVSSLLQVEEEFHFPEGKNLNLLFLFSFFEVIYSLSLFFGISVSSSVFMSTGQILIVPTGYIVELILLGFRNAEHTLGNYIGALFIIFGFLLVSRTED